MNLQALAPEVQKLLKTAGMHLRQDAIPANPFAGMADRLLRDVAIGPNGQAVTRHDAIAFERHLEYLSTRAHLAVYPELTSTLAFPLTPDSPPPGSQSYAWPEVTRLAGGAHAGTGYSGLGPSSEVDASKKTTPVGVFTAHYGYDIGEQQRAQLGYPLNTLKGIQARRIIEQDQNSAIWTGDTNRGLPGVLTNSDIVKTQVTAGASTSRLWANKEADEICKDIETEVTAMVAALNGNKSLYPNRWSLPASRRTQLSLMKRSLGTDLSVLDYLQAKLMAATEQSDFQITSHPELETGAGTGGDAWGILYRYDTMVAGRVVAMPFAELAPQLQGFGYLVPCHAQSGGLAVFKPVAVRIHYGF